MKLINKIKVAIDSPAAAGESIAILIFFFNFIVMNGLNL